MTEAKAPDQSHVFEDQEQYQTPPELIRTPEEKENIKKTRKKVLLIFVVVVFLAMTVVGIFALSKMERPEPAPLPTPTPLPTQSPSMMKQALDRLDGVVKTADPASEPFSPPPVDMEVEF